MFGKIYRFGVKALLRQKVIVFWLFLFPIMLSTLFHFAFSNMLSDEKLEKIDIAIVKSEKTDENFLKILDEADLFNYKIENQEKADKLLLDGKVKAVVNYKDKVEIEVSSSTVETTIVKSFFDTYMQTSGMIEGAIKENKIDMTKIGELQSSLQANYIKEKPINGKTDVTVIFYYGLISMVCVLCSTLGDWVISIIQANQTSLAARFSVAPVNKYKSYFALFCSTMTFQILAVSIMLVYMNKVLGVDFGKDLAYIWLICIAGSVVSFAFGTLLSAAIVKRAGLKMGITLVISIFGASLAGMVSTDIKYFIHAYLPVIEYINPASIITNGMYALYYYGVCDKYFLNLIILIVLTVVFSGLTLVLLRRQKYEYI